ncbi:MAG: DUF3179 domain-containing (seleno)protein [Isosphaeraceae bacterium]
MSDSTTSQGASPEVPVPSSRNLVLPRGLTYAALATLLTFIAVQGHSLWNEWSSLQEELQSAKKMQVIGYPGIQPRYSFARRPVNWFRNEGGQTFLWGGWVEGSGHTWFLTGEGDLDRDRILPARPRDVQLAIDQAITESEGGGIWDRVPDDSLVLVGKLAGVPTAYPVLVMDKVGVVNDQIQNQPFVVTYNPLASEEELGTVYEGTLDGHRVTMGTTGYFHDRKPLFYDRGSESLWVGQESGLSAIAGKHKGRVLPKVLQARPVAWRYWRSSYPDGRLVVGADRSRAIPEL